MFEGLDIPLARNTGSKQESESDSSTSTSSGTGNEAYSLFGG